MNMFFCSFGKDSIANILIAHELGIPIDQIVYCEVLFDEWLSGEIPIHRVWIPFAEQRLKEITGAEIVHIRSDINFKDQFYTTKKRGKHIGEIYGFPYIVGSWCNSVLKMRAINKHVAKYDNVVQFVGIAADEPNRIERLNNKLTHRSILAETNTTEKNAMEICKKHNLLSPAYDMGFSRLGCWFCPKMSKKSFNIIAKFYPNFLNMLKKMDKDSRCKFMKGIFQEIGESKNG